MKYLIDEMDQHFVEEYEDIVIYKFNIEKILDQMGFESFESYNDFCLRIRENIIYKIDRDNLNRLDSSVFSGVLNKVLRDKMREDSEYEKKIVSYFNDYEVINVINTIDRIN